MSKNYAIWCFLDRILPLEDNFTKKIRTIFVKYVAKVNSFV